MTKDVLNVVIDERKDSDTQGRDALALKQGPRFSSTTRVFKDYILASEVFDLRGSED